MEEAFKFWILDLGGKEIAGLEKGVLGIDHLVVRRNSRECISVRHLRIFASQLASAGL
jgi:hypothetical protein